VHGQDAAGDEFSVLPDGEVPGLDPHEVVKGKFKNQSALCAYLSNNKMGNTLSEGGIHKAFITPA
jgi:hypothetical protein